MSKYGHDLIKGKVVYLSSVGGFVSFGFALLLAGLLFGPPYLRGIFNSVPLRLVRLISYSAYLWHIPAIFIASQLPFIARLPPTLRFPLLLGHALIGTVVSAAFFLPHSRETIFDQKQKVLDSRCLPS